MRTLRFLLVTAAVALLAALAFLYSGFYDVAADEPHWGITSWVMETARDRSIALRARSAGEPPDLDDARLQAEGAGHYAQMCAGCHLAPGIADTELRAGLYPQPPDLVELGNRRPPAEVFWIIKHGVKMSGMPAWGPSHDDTSIWGMVAFLRKLPDMSPAQYEQMTGAGAGGHGHGGEDGAHGHDEKPAPGIQPGQATGAGHVDAPGSKPHSH